jgi:hypothetical protein
MGEVTLEMIQSMLQRVLDTQRKHDDKFAEVINRLGRVELEVAGLHGDFASLSVRLDRFGERVDRIERRLDLAE